MNIFRYLRRPSFTEVQIILLVFQLGIVVHQCGVIVRAYARLSARSVHKIETSIPKETPMYEANCIRACEARGMVLLCAEGSSGACACTGGL